MRFGAPILSRGLLPAAAMVVAILAGCSGPPGQSSAAAPSAMSSASAVPSASVGPLGPTPIAGGAESWGPQFCVVVEAAITAYAAVHKVEADARLLDKEAVRVGSMAAGEPLLTLGDEIARLPEWGPGTSTNLALDTAWKSWAVGLAQVVVAVNAKDVSALNDGLDLVASGDKVFKTALDTYVTDLQPKHPSLVGCARASPAP
jgi:hypothetical protein